MIECIDRGVWSKYDKYIFDEPGCESKISLLVQTLLSEVTPSRRDLLRNKQHYLLYLIIGITQIWRNLFYGFNYLIGPLCEFADIEFLPTWSPIILLRIIKNV